MNAELVACPGCGVLLPDKEGPTHRYMESSPACWEAFGEVLAREYSDSAYFEVHRLTVDAYAVQHPGQSSPQAINSVAHHLIRLYYLVERGLDPRRANDLMLHTVNLKQNYFWLEPPESLGEVTVVDVQAAETVEAHKRAVRDWAVAVWKAWEPHHETIRKWAPAFD